MIEDIASITGTRIGPGTLYGAIARLEAEGMIEALQSDDRRRPYDDYRQIWAANPACAYAATGHPPLFRPTLSIRRTP